MEGLGKPINKKVIVWKVLKTLPARFNPKVFVLEDRSNLSNPSMDELHVILTTYEMRTEEQDGSSNIETTFKASKKTEKGKQVSKPRSSNCKEEEEGEEFSNEEFGYLTRKIKRGTGKYKGKLSLACFDCGEIGHFAAKCPRKNETYTKGKKGQRNFNKKRGFKKSFFCNKDSSSSKEESDSDAKKQRKSIIYG